MRSGRVASIWPSLTKVTPRRPSPPERPRHRRVRLTGRDVSATAEIPAEPVLRRDGDDLRIPAAAAPPRGNAAEPGNQPGQRTGRDYRLEDDEHGQPEGDRPGQAEEEQQQRLQSVELGGDARTFGLDHRVDAGNAADELDDAAEHPGDDQADDDGPRPADRHSEQPPRDEPEDERVDQRRDDDGELVHAAHCLRNAAAAGSMRACPTSCCPTR